MGCETKGEIRGWVYETKGETRGGYMRLGVGAVVGI